MKYTKVRVDWFAWLRTVCFDYLHLENYVKVNQCIACIEFFHGSPMQGKPTNRLEIDLKIDFVDLWFAIVKVN